MTDTFQQGLVDITNYYDYRAEMFMSLQNAAIYFEDGDNNQMMWSYLFEYAMLNEATKEMFDAFSYDTLSILVGSFGGKIIIAGNLDE